MKVPDGYEPKVTLFRTVWMLHSGELFGTAGKLVVDAVAVVLVLLCLTGLAYWLLPKDMRRRHRHGRHTEGEARWTRLSLLWRQAGTHHYHTDPLGGRYGLVSPSTRHDTVGSD